MAVGRLCQRYWYNLLKCLPVRIHWLININLSFVTPHHEAQTLRGVLSVKLTDWFAGSDTLTSIVCWQSIGDIHLEALVVEQIPTNRETEVECHWNRVTLLALSRSRTQRVLHVIV
eukprot:902752_1